MRKILIFMILIGLTTSCMIKENINDYAYHYKKLTRDKRIRQDKYSKNTNTIEGVRFLVANQPDQILNLDGVDFHNRYNRLLDYLKNDGFTIIVNEKLNMIATIIAEVNKPILDTRYIGIVMEQNSHMKIIKYNIFYCGSKFLAYELYEGYKKSLENPKYL